jgi:hypothetical protein
VKKILISNYFKVEFTFLRFFFGGGGLARKVLHNLSHAPKPFLFNLFFNIFAGWPGP